MSVIITGKNVGTTNITSTYTDILGITSTPQELTVTAVSLASISKPSDVTYNGQAYTPTPDVTAIEGDNNTETILELGTDYTLTYSNNTNAGTATVTATGIGNHTGTVSTTWVINQAEITGVVANDQSYIYDGHPHGSAVTVTADGWTPVIKYGTVSGTYNLNTAPQITDITSSDNTIYFQITDPDNNHTPYTGSYLLVISQGLFVKISGIWTPVKKVYKKVNGSWEEQTDIASAFNTSQYYWKDN